MDGLRPLPFLVAVFALSTFFSVLMIHRAHGGPWWATVVLPVACFALIVQALWRVSST
jgi:hypothetical protein